MSFYRFRLFSLLTLVFLFSAFPVSAGWMEKEKGIVQGLQGIAKTGETYFAVGNTGKAIRSTDQGVTWSLFEQAGSVYWQDIEPFGSKLLMIGESGSVRESDDGGKTWSQLSFGISDHLYDIEASTNNGYIVGANGQMLAHSQATNRWNLVNSPTLLSLFSVQDMKDGRAWSVGAQGILLYSADGGVNWTNKGKIAATDLYGVWFSGSIGFAVGKNGFLIKTIDNGSTWSQLSVAGLLAQWLFDIEGVGDQLVAVGDKIILRSTDGGVNWTVQDFSSQNYTFKDVTFIGSEVWVVGTKDDVQSVIMKFEADTVPSTSQVDTGSETVSPSTSETQPGTLIKTACSPTASVNDLCRAVYFYATDGKRHAFPNEKVFFTWFDDFDSVKEVSSTFLSSLTLGKNVTYHPGTKMVKFQSVPTVYAVNKKGVLRAIASEQVASQLYGTDWNKKIEDISDAFFGNYTFGTKIELVSQYDVAAEKSSVQSLNDQF